MTRSQSSLPSLDGLRKAREADQVLARREARHRAALDEVIKRRRAISERISQAEELFRDLEDLLGDIDDEDVSPTSPADDVSDKPTPKKRRSRTVKGEWTTTIKDLAEQANRPLRYDELRAMIMETDLAETMEKTQKSFYGAIGRLANNEDIVRENGYVFSLTAYEQYQEHLRNGGKPLSKVHHGHASPTADEIKRYLDGRAFGATSAEIIEHLRSTDLREKIEKNKTFAYNVLSRLKDRGELTKEGDNYCLPRNNEGPAEARPSKDTGETKVSSNSRGFI